MLFWSRPGRPHVSHPARYSKVVDREPVEKVMAAVLVTCSNRLHMHSTNELGWYEMSYLLQEEKYMKRGCITFRLSHTTCRQPPLTHDMDDILLHNHLIVEAGLVPKEQCDIAEITLDLPGKCG